MEATQPQQKALAHRLNQTRFRLLAVCGAVSVFAILLLLLIARPLFGISLGEALRTGPLVIAIGAFTGTAQIFLNEYWLQRIVWLAHPEGIDAPQAEPVLALIIKIALAISAFLLPLLVGALYTFHVTAFDLIRLGLEDLPDFLLAYTVAFLVLAGGYFLYRKAWRHADRQAPAPTDPAHLRDLMEGVHSFVLRSAVASLLLWFCAALLAAWGARFFARLDMVLSLWVLVAVVAFGVAAFPIQYFAFRRIFAPVGEGLLTTAGEAYRVESAARAAESIEDEHVLRERLFTIVRLGVAIPAWGALVLVHQAIEPFYIGLLTAYTVLILFGYAATFVPALRELASLVRLVGDGLALTLFIQYSGSMTTLIVGFYFMMVYSITLHHGFERGLLAATFYTVLYGGMLLCEYLGWLTYAPAVIDGGDLLELLLHRTPWRHFHPSALFLTAFIVVAGGMFLATFLAHLFVRRRGGVRELLDLD